MQSSFSASGTPKDICAQLDAQVTAAAAGSDATSADALRAVADRVKAAARSAPDDALVIVSGSFHFSVSVVDPSKIVEASDVEIVGVVP
jgi:3-dehydroquinate dehydratase